MWVCESSIVHYLNGTGLHCAPHCAPVLCIMMHKGGYVSETFFILWWFTWNMHKTDPFCLYLVVHKNIQHILFWEVAPPTWCTVHRVIPAFWLDNVHAKSSRALLNQYTATLCTKVYVGTKLHFWTLICMYVVNHRNTILYIMPFCTTWACLLGAYLTKVPRNTDNKRPFCACSMWTTKKMKNVGGDPYFMYFSKT